MAHVHFLALRLTDGLERLDKPGGVDVEGLAPLDAGELDRAQNIILVFIVTDDARFTAQSAFNSEVGTGLDQAEVIGIRCCRTTKVA